MVYKSITEMLRKEKVVATLYVTIAEQKLLKQKLESQFQMEIVVP